MEKLSEDFTEEVRQSWHRFLQRTESARPDLHRYCRSLTGSVWDAEDLVQDTLLRAFAKLGEYSAEIAAKLGLPLATNGYGNWAPEFIELRKEEEFQQWRASLHPEWVDNQ